MEARLYRAALLSAALVCLAFASAQAASFRTTNFVVTAPTPQMAQEICQQAETFRRDLAIEWLGHELPQWTQPCPISAQVAPNLGAGGATSFMFDRGRPFGWRMSIQGSYERVLDSVLPHEVTHTIFATHFGQPLPRWADEGACTTVEHESEKSKQQQNLVRFLQTNRGIAFNKMFAMKEYPPDVLPLYAQGYSVVRFMIAQRGKQHFVAYVGEGLRTENWPAVTQKYYGYRDLSDLQTQWVAWVAQGSPPLQQQGAEVQVAAANVPQSQAASQYQQIAQANNLVPQQQMIARGQSPDQPSPDGYPLVPVQPLNQTQPLNNVAQNGAALNQQLSPAPPTPMYEGQTLPQTYAAPAANAYQPAATAPANAVVEQTATRPQPAGQPQQTVLEWTRAPATTASRPAPTAGRSYYDRGLLDGGLRR